MSNECKAVPVNCRQRLAAEGKPYPRSSCAACGQLSPNWRECESMLARPVPQPPALDGEPDVFAWAENVEEPGPLGGIVTHRFKHNCVRADGSPGGKSHTRPLILLSDHRAHVAPLQAEIERQAAQFKDWQASHHSNYVAVAKERDQLKARCDELEAALKFYADGDHLIFADHDQWDTCSGEPVNWLHDEAGTASIEDGSLAKQALSKPAGSEQV